MKKRKYKDFFFFVKNKKGFRQFAFPLVDGIFSSIPYAETHDQTFVHCQRFFTAAVNTDGPCFSPTVAFTPVRKAMDPWLGML